MALSIVIIVPLAVRIVKFIKRIKVLLNILMRNFEYTYYLVVHKCSENILVTAVIPVFFETSYSCENIILL